MLNLKRSSELSLLPFALQGLEWGPGVAQLKPSEGATAQGILMGVRVGPRVIRSTAVTPAPFVSSALGQREINALI